MATTTAQHGCPMADIPRDFDPFAEDYLRDPYPSLRELREREPVFYSPRLDYWVISRYDDVQEGFLNQDDYSASIALDTIVPPYPSSIEIMRRYAFEPGLALVNEDPPLHHTRRKRFARSFSPQRMKAMEPFIRELANRYIDRFVKRGEADLVGEMVFELPALVVFKLFGIPDEDVEEVKAYAGELALFNWGLPDEGEQNRLVEMVCRYREYGRKHIAYIREHPGEDMVSDLLAANAEDPELFPEEYILSSLPNFLYAGHETTTSQSGNAFRILLEHREQWGRICGDPSLAGNAVEECLRAVSSVIAWRRKTKRALTVRGVDIPAGANVLIYSGAANHDAAVFDDPEAFDIDRDNAKRHLSFGYGAHLCLGAPLARVELKVMIEELSRRLPHLELVEGQPWTYSANTSFRGPKRLLVRWDPSRNPLPADRT